MATLLLISLDPTLIGSVAETAKTIDGLGLEVVAEDDEAYPLLQRKDFLLVVFHLTEGASVTGVTRLLKTIKLERPSVALMVVSDVHRPIEALALLRLGATDYQVRPLDLNYLASLVELLSITARQNQKGANARAARTGMKGVALAPVLEERADCSAFLELDQVLEQVRRIALRDTTILLEGETGTGKTRLAGDPRALTAARKAVPGHQLRGAVGQLDRERDVRPRARGVHRRRRRSDRQVRRGRPGHTVPRRDRFACLCRSRPSCCGPSRSGFSSRSARTGRRPMQARLIVASNRPLEQEVAAGRFRADLFYRLNVVDFVMPPLRQRPRAFPALAEEFLAEYAARSERTIEGIAPDALECLLAYSWPGNIRELRNVHRARRRPLQGPDHRPRRPARFLPAPSRRELALAVTRAGQFQRQSRSQDDE